MSSSCMGSGGALLSGNDDAEGWEGSLEGFVDSDVSVKGVESGARGFRVDSFEGDDWRRLLKPFISHRTL